MRPYYKLSKDTVLSSFSMKYLRTTLSSFTVTGPSMWVIPYLSSQPLLHHYTITTPTREIVSYIFGENDNNFYDYIFINDDGDKMIYIDEDATFSLSGESTSNLDKTVLMCYKLKHL